MAVSFPSNVNSMLWYSCDVARRDRYSRLPWLPNTPLPLIITTIAPILTTPKITHIHKSMPIVTIQHQPVKQARNHLTI
jgi:hypothetical protein